MTNQPVISRGAGWSGQQDLNLRQPLDSTHCDSDGPPRGPGTDRPKAPCDSDNSGERAARATADPRDGFYVRTIDGEPDRLGTPIYEKRGPKCRIAASRWGSTDFIYDQGDRPFPPWLVRAGDTYEQAAEFAIVFYTLPPAAAATNSRSAS